MKINLHIIFDELKSSEARIIAREDFDYVIADVRYLPKDYTKLSEHYVYFADGLSLQEIRSCGKKLQFVLFGKADESLLAVNNWSAILVPETDRNIIFEEVQQIFEKYNQWEDEVFLAIANGDSAQQVFEICARILRNPIALFDLSGILIFKAGDLPEDLKNTSWEDVMRKGYAPGDKYSPSEQKEVFKLIQSHKKPFVYQSYETFGEQKEVMTTLSKDGIPFAYLGSTDILAPFTFGQLAIIHYVQRIMEMVLKKDYASYLAGHRDITLFIERIIRGQEIDKHTLAYYLKKMKWQLKDNFCLLFFYKSDDSPVEKMFMNICSNTIKDLLGDALLLLYDDGIWAILHNDADWLKDEVNFHNLTLYLERTDMFCAVSISFYDFLYIKHAYNQCRIVRASVKEKSSPRICRYETVYMQDILDSLSTFYDIYSLCHPQILYIYNNWINGKEYIKSLQIYLINGRNITSAANMLHIHRNTLIYRLDRMKEELNLDFTEIDERTLLILYLSCLIAKYLDEE
ncbi:MAG: helix-turn-helix domain-containing protein [Clostridiales bacterium]|jgi:hypothetical protein|nr:helix-turn-helix domain-containing protein [Eubacteriales bacterium]MDH7565483.1 helix-turn-helix domain-containing protein [Clostridiales bacterium]